MSYEPDIIIYKPDLDKKQDEILQHQYGKFRKKARSDAAVSKQAAWDTLESILHNQQGINLGFLTKTFLPKFL